MTLNTIDWLIIVSYFVVALLIGIWASRRAGRSLAEFFLSGRTMPWWLLGASMVATTFSCDTPTLITDMVRQNGVAGYWEAWVFLLTGMLTVFVYAKLWRRSGVLTDLEFYELRYSGKPAAFLRGFRALYLGAIFNLILIAGVTLAAIKIGGAMLGLSPLQTIGAAAVVTLVYSMLGGLRAVLLTDLLLFTMAMIGSVVAAVVAVNHEAVGGLAGLMAHQAVQPKLPILPDFNNYETMMSIFIIPLAVQWWSVWYPGAEPGGGGFVAQRMLAAKNERHATGAMLMFAAMHYAVRPWPWLLVALSSIIVFPNLEALQTAFPHIHSDFVKHDLAYPAMLTFLPHGMLGFVLASLIAAYMSTISTLLNWGSSYLTNDFYRRFLRKDASEKELVLVGRVYILALLIIGSALAFWFQNQLNVFHIILQIGAGTGLLFLLRWFWWRINAACEIAAMIVSFLMAIAFEILEFQEVFGPEGIKNWVKIVTGVAITTVSWLLVMFLTRPTDQATLYRFCRLIRPGGPGWRAVIARAQAEGNPVDYAGEKWTVPMGILCMFIGCTAVYSALFGTGYWIYGNYLPAVILSCVGIVSSVLLIVLWGRVSAG